MERSKIRRVSPVFLEKSPVIELKSEASLASPSETSASDGDSPLVIGSSNLYDQNGQVRLIPAPSPDPRDPLNLPNWRKATAIVAVAFFGALALSAEAIIAALTPVFALEYAGINPKILDTLDLSAIMSTQSGSANVMNLLASFGGPPLWKISMLATLPLLTNGVSSYFLVPLSIAIGRRPLLIMCGLLAWVGGLWAGMSKSLDSHLAARCLQGLGAGAVEALIPLMVQDIIFIHNRNRAMSSIWAAQGLIIVGLGISSPVIVVTLGWRWIYFITSGLAFVAWFGLIFGVPETRWKRSQAELAGKSLYYINPGEKRPRQDTVSYQKRTIRTDLGLFPNGFAWKDGFMSMVETGRSMFYPSIIWVICIDSVLVSTQVAAGQVGSSILLSRGWKFRLLGLSVIPIVIATPFVWLLGGWLADRVANMIARRRGGHREPESHLITLALPLMLGVLGTVLFGYAGQQGKELHWIVYFLSVFLAALSALAANTIIAVYAVESYPQIPGPILVNVSSFRCIIGFAMSFKATTWVEDLGFLASFSIYAGVLAFFSCMLPIFYFYGKTFRRWTSGTVPSPRT